MKPISGTILARRKVRAGKEGKVGKRRREMRKTHVFVLYGFRF